MTNKQEQLIRLYLAGVKYKHIAEKMGYKNARSCASAIKRLRRSGVNLPPRPGGRPSSVGEMNELIEQVQGGEA